jgi:hypothetical protein
MKKETYNEDSIFIDKNYVASSNSFITSTGKEYKITPGDDECKSHFIDENELRNFINISPLKKSVQKFGFPIVYPRVAKIIDVAAEKAENERIANEKLIADAIAKSKLKLEVIEKLYSIKDELGSAFNGITATKITKKPLHNSYVEIYNFYLSKINAESDIKAKMVLIDKISNISEKIVNLRNQETKELEKSLKKAVTIEEKENLILNQ